LTKAKETWKANKRRRITTFENEKALSPLLVDSNYSAAENMAVVEDGPAIAV
jgi:hypothetical protein